MYQDEHNKRLPDIEELKNKINRLESDYENIENQVNQDTAYSGISATRKALLVIDRTKKISSEMQSLISMYNIHA